jgi:hypothetical protein
VFVDFIASKLFSCVNYRKKSTVSNQNLFSWNPRTVKFYFAAYTPYISAGIFKFSGFNVSDSECEFCDTHISI